MHVEFTLAFLIQDVHISFFVVSPQIAGVPIDVVSVYLAVNSFGGFEEVRQRLYYQFGSTF